MTTLQIIAQGTKVVVALLTTLTIFAQLNPWKPSRWLTPIYFTVAFIFSIINSSFIVYGIDNIYTELAITAAFSFLAAFIEFGFVYILVSVFPDIARRIISH